MNHLINELNEVRELPSIQGESKTWVYFVIAVIVVIIMIMKKSIKHRHKADFIIRTTY